MNTVRIKPLSVNQAWQGRRFKTPAYKKYAQELMLLLPRDLKVPETGDLEVYFEFGLNKLADWDNAIKAFQDILGTFYNFNDARITKALVIKEVVKPGNGYIKFSIKQREL